MVAGMAATAFASCTALRTVSFGKSYMNGTLPSNLYIGGNNVFHNCPNLQSLYLWASSVYQINSTTFAGSPVDSGTTKIYVLASMLDTYKSYYLWSRYASQIYAIP